MAAKLPTLETSARPTPQPSGGIASYRGPTGAETATGESLIRLAGDMGTAGDQIHLAFKAEEEKTNTLRAEEAFSKLRERQLQLTFGEKDGFTNLKGSQAIDRPLAKEYGGRFNQAYREIESGLANDDQKIKFRTRATAARLQFDEGILRHLAQENDAYAKQVTDGAIKTEVAAVAANPYSGEAMALSLERVNALIDKEIARQGFTGKDATEQADNAKRRAKDAMWNARIEAIMYQQPMTADKLFRDNANQISDPQLRLTLQARTREAAFGVQGTMEATRIIEEFRSSPERAQATTVGMILPPELQEALKRMGSGEATEKDKKEITAFYKSQGAKAVDIKDGVVLAGGMPGADPVMGNTSGLPMARDIAAELPLMLTKVEKRADALYGTDPSNPDRAAFVRRVTQELQSKVAADVQQLNALQKRNQGMIIDAVAGLSAPGNGMMAAGGRGGAPGAPITSFAQIQSNPTLLAAWMGMDVQAKVGVMNMIESNQRGDKGNDKLYWEAFERIHAKVGDPRRIELPGQLIELAGPGRLSSTQLNELRREMERDDSKSVTSLRVAAAREAERSFNLNLNTNVKFLHTKMIEPDAAMTWARRWKTEVDGKVDALVEQGRPDLVRALFQADSKDYVLGPEYLQTFMTPGTTIKDQADAVRQGAKPNVAPAKMPATVTDTATAEAWFKTLPADQTTFVGPDGQTRWIPGRKPQGADAAAAAPGAGKPAPATQAAPAVAMDAAGKIVTPPAPKPARDPNALPKFAGSRYAVSPEEQARLDAHFEGLKAAAASVATTVGNAVIEAGLMGIRTRQALVEMVTGLVGNARRDTARATFQAVLEADTFASEDVPVIEAALKYGDLSADDRKKARAMLRMAKGN